MHNMNNPRKDTSSDQQAISSETNDLTNLVVPYPGMVVTQDATFKPGVYHFRNGEGITIAADHITVNGNGAVIVGPGKKERPRTYKGTPLISSSCSHVTVKNLTGRGFILGVYVTGSPMNPATSWIISDNNFSDNFSDPNNPGFGVDQPFGAIRLECVNDSTIRDNQGDYVWNGLYLSRSNNNRIIHNHFSHCSNTCLYFWSSSNNVVENNVMSYGIRILSGYSHALDSASALIEAGSNNNLFKGNDFTHGGDGVFIRTNNQVISTGNYFIENDASYAFNNAWECRSPGNIFEKNIGNYSSYGFWLGGSSHTVLINNEAAFNGTIHKNNPNPYIGNAIAGIAVIWDPSSHFICQGNNVHDNNGVGIALGNPSPGFHAVHWILQQNTITNNTSYGIYIQDVEWLDIAGNIVANNGGDMFIGQQVSEVSHRTASLTDHPPQTKATTSTMVTTVNSSIQFDASSSSDPAGLPLTYRWDLGDGTISQASTVSHSYSMPGFYRVGITVNNGKLSSLAWFDIYIVSTAPEIGTDGEASQWFCSRDADQIAQFSNDDMDRIKGEYSTKMVTGDSFPVYAGFPSTRDAKWDISGKSILELWVKKYTTNGWRDDADINNPTIILATDKHNYFRYTPHVSCFRDASVHQEAWYGWQYIAIPLAGDDFWRKTSIGTPSLSSINYLEIVTGTYGAGYIVWFDGLGFL
jgi:parallel beta-helix repeat protein